MDERSEIVDLSDSRFPSKRCPEDDFDEQPEGGKRIKMRDLDSVLRSGVMKKCSKLTEAKVDRHHSSFETSQITDTAASLASDKPAQLVTCTPSIEPTNDICLRLGLPDSVESSENLASSVTHKVPEKEPNAHNTNLVGLNLDLNDDPFHPYKHLGQVRSVDASECGSTTGPLEESEPLRMWKEMKQNGFLSSSHGGIPLPKQRGRQPKRKKQEGTKKKVEVTKGEPPNKYAKIAAPSGLLSGLNPGIIKHVRNSKQVNSIIEAMLQSEKSASQMDNRHLDQCGNGSKDFTAHSSGGNQYSLHLNRSSFLSVSEYEGQMMGSGIAGKFNQESSTRSQFNPEYVDDSLTLKLSSAVAMASEFANSTCNDNFSTGQDAIASLSLKGAAVASQWLDLLQQDIKGRLAALRRSKKRVRNVIQTELPYLLSKEISCNQENEGYFAHASEGGCSKKAILDMHMARWKSIFSQMDKALHEEGKHLESWLKQVQDMQSHCEGGLKYFGANRMVLLAEEFSGLKTKEAVEKENAVRAAAASIYSTSNLIMTKENVPCF